MGRKNDNDVKPLVINFFKNQHLDVVQISEGEFKSADIMVKKGPHTCLIEIKEKLDNDSQYEVTNGASIVSAEKIERNNKYSRIVDRAVSQLTDSSMPKADFRAIWFEFQNGDIQTHIHQVLHSLFGIRIGVPVPEGKNRFIYYCTESDFWKHRKHLNGVFVSKNGLPVLAVNSNHESFEKFVVFAKFLELKMFGHDLKIAEEKGEIFIADFDIDRRLETEVSAALSKKYGFEAMFLMPFVKMSIKI